MYLDARSALGALFMCLAAAVDLNGHITTTAVAAAAAMSADQRPLFMYPPCRFHC